MHFDDTIRLSVIGFNNVLLLRQMAACHFVGSVMAENDVHPGAGGQGMRPIIKTNSGAYNKTIKDSWFASRKAYPFEIMNQLKYISILLCYFSAYPPVFSAILLMKINLPSCVNNSR